jgi:5-epi-alpha-selinene synthase
MLQHLALLANKIVCCLNDVVSLRKELETCAIHNLVIVLQNERRITRQAAIDLAISMHDADMRAFVELAAWTPSFGREVDVEVKRYVAGLRFWVRANMDWSFASDRYLSPGEEDAEAPLYLMEPGAPSSKSPVSLRATC